MAIIKNNLGFDSDLEIFQDKEMFNYSVDTIMLGNFVTLNNNVKKILEIGTNNGALSIFVSARKEKIKIDAIEIQEQAIKLAKENIKHNNFEDKINLINEDFNIFYKELAKNNIRKYDLIICNPPFYKVDSSIMHNGNYKKQIA